MYTLENGGQSRDSYVEGRTCGVGTTFAIRKDENTLKFIMAHSACKDYLHDVLYVESFNKPFNVYGFDYSSTGVFSGEFTYLCLRMLDHRDGDNWRGFDSHSRLLMKRYHNIEKVLNHFEGLLGFTESMKSKLVHADGKDYIVAINKWWVAAPYRISLVSLLARSAYLLPKAVAKSPDLFEILRTRAFKHDDLNSIKKLIPKIEYLICNPNTLENLELREQKLTDKYGWHNTGIYEMVFTGIARSPWLI